MNRLTKPALALCGWTLFVWLNRIKNVVDDRSSVGGELEGWAFAWRLGVALGFCVLSVLGVVLLLITRRSGRSDAPSRSLVRATSTLFTAFAGLGIVWWTVRGIGTLLDDFTVGFKIVHTVLALVTISLGLVVLRVARLGPRYG